jgi:hypothetical protein
LNTTTRQARSDNGRSPLGEGRIPKALLDADVATLRAALEQKSKEEIQDVLEQLRELDARRTELNARLMGLGYRQGGSAPLRMRSTGGVRGKRSDLADGSAETIITEALQAAPNERPGFYYEKVITAGGNMGQGRRILAALVSSGKVRAEGNRPHTRYSLA